ncbi:polysaccharide biosynthesis tyrosine autokinase [uncultured Draconibacterium sp.]|uniref:GumC family protein n=1 Tax=uncultured Draconibacterium sp. TaxID=1573823 RepID=UPI0029C90CB4|nr:polysaccharide biosynthesis tyrosine autokinase [uncultured Draconibacterium sp.]
MEKIEDILKIMDSAEKKRTKTVLVRYLKKWPWFVAFCITGIFIGYFHYRNSPNIFQIKSRILIINEEGPLSSVLAFDNSVSNFGKKANIENKIGILQSYTLYRKALENLNWDYSWYVKKMLYNAELYNGDPFELVLPPGANNAKNIQIEIEVLNNNEYKLQAKGETYLNGYAQYVDISETVKFGELWINNFFNFQLNKANGLVGETYILKFNDVNTLTSQYLDKTKIELEELNSDIISITVNGENAQKEADFINELNKVFIRSGMEKRNENSENSVEFIDSQLSRIKKSLGNAEENFSNYRTNNQVMNLGQEAQLIYAKLEEIEQEQYLTQLQIDFYIQLQQYLDNAKKIGEMVNPSIIGITDENLNSTLQNLKELHARREVLTYSVQEKNPKLILLDKEIKITRDGLEETLKNQLKATQSKKESLDERSKTVQQRLSKLPETEKKLISIQRDFDLNNELYTYMLQKKAEVSISKASISPEVQVIDDALVEAAKQVGPNIILNVGTGIVGGLFIPFAIISLLSFFNNKIESLEEVEKESIIPVFEGIIKHKYKSKLPIIDHPRSGVAECFRGVKSNINTLLDGRSNSNIISINSLVPAEGKSFISANLSATFSKTNKKVLLIGADLHKPALHNFLLVKESYGLSNYLNEEKNLEDITTKTSIPNLYFIQAGSFQKNPSDLFDTEKFKEFIEQIKRKFDYIIIDNAPLLLVPDAILTSHISNISLFILRENCSHKEQIKQINKIVRFNNLKTAAIVMNDISSNSFGYGYGNKGKYWKKGYGEYRQTMKIV